MKNPAGVVVFVLIASGLLSCKKSSGVNSSGNIAGKWMIQKDSVTRAMGPGETGTNYVGTATDYFDFRTDKRLYTREGALLDTFTYTITSDTTLTLGGVGASINLIPLHVFIKSLNATTVRLDIEPSLWNPGGNTTRFTILTR